MADRLTFKFTMKAKVISEGEVEIDVKDPTDQKEIIDLLKARDFASCVHLDKKYDNETWEFSPKVGEGHGGILVG